MKRVAIVGGGISGLTAAYELERARRAGRAVEWELFEASERLGGIVETTRLPAPGGEYVLEGGPDGWVSEKPWARELATELGLAGELIASNDATRRTYVLRDGRLLPIPERMRLMVPEDVSALAASPLFNDEARAAYAAEPSRADELRRDALAEAEDESVASFVRRHFGDDVVRTLAAPLLAGVFGGDVERLSVRAVMPQMVALEREYGSLIAGLKAKSRARGERAPQPIFTSLRRGMATLIEALAAELPPERVHLRQRVEGLEHDESGWTVHVGHAQTPSRFDAVLLATPLGATLELLRPIVADAHEFLPRAASSALLAAFTWTPAQAATFAIPGGFGFLVPPSAAPRDRPQVAPPLLACTFVDQKFPHRAPEGARVLRAFFGGASAAALERSDDAQIAAAALAQLRSILGPIPAPEHVSVRRWPGSLPQYETGHLDRMAQLERVLADVPGLHLLGNSYHGVGLPDLVREARARVHSLAC